MHIVISRVKTKKIKYINKKLMKEKWTLKITKVEARKEKLTWKGDTNSKVTDLSQNIPVIKRM